MRPTRVVLVVLLITGVGTTLLSQGELVIYKAGTNLYHRPGCPVLRDGEGLLALTRGQAEARGYKPHPDCDPSQQAAATARGGAPGAASKPASITVYVDGSKYYHRKDCSKLAAGKRAVEAQSLETAGKTYWPCPTCKPPVRRKGVEPAVPGTGRRGR